MAIAPDDKPSFVDGDIFSGRQEHIVDFRVGKEMAIDGHASRFPIALRSRDGSGSIPWTNDVVVIREDGRWVVDDVKYDVDQPDARESSLLDDLRDGTAATDAGTSVAQ